MTSIPALPPKILANISEFYFFRNYSFNLAFILSIF